LITMLLPLGIVISIAASASSLNVMVDGNLATITGTNLGSGSQAVIHIDAPDGQIFYIGVANIQNGVLNHSFRMIEPISGVYSVRVRANGSGSQVVAMTFMVDGSGTLPPNADNIEINVVTGQNYTVFVSAQNITNGNREVIISYDPAYLRVEDSMARTFARTLNAGVGIRTDVNVIEFNPNAGLIRFRFNYDTTNGRTFSGVPILVRFVGIQNGATVVEVR